jgi:hypothetical protein
MIGLHKVAVRLTVDLIPEIEVIVHREGEPPESALEEEEKEAIKAEETRDKILDEEPAEEFDTEFTAEDQVTDDVVDETDPGGKGEKNSEEE